MISRFSNITQANIRLQKQTQLKKDSHNQNSNPSFGNAAVALGTQALNFLNTNPAVGACFVDFFSMVTPRTAVDMGRSLDAGIETGIRESTGTVNHAMAGLVGLGAGYAVSAAFNKANGVNAHLMFLNGHAIDTFKDFVKSSERPVGYDNKAYWTKFFKSLQGLNTDNGQSWHKLSDEVIEKAANIMSSEAGEKYSVSKKAMAEVVELITGETGAGSSFKVMKPSANGAVSSEIETGVNGSLRELVESAHSMFKAVRDKAKHDNKAIVQDLEKFLNGVKNRKVATVAAGLAIPVGIGIAAQPVNRYLTKKRTGTDGFVGVEGREPNRTTSFKVIKALLGVGLGSAMIATILKKPTDLYTKFGSASKEILSKLQYKGKVPTLDQFKFIYGMTIMSRIMAARDENEVRECTIKDTLGFANWLILGGFVSKLAAKSFNKGLLNYNEAIHGKGTWNVIKNAVEKTHEEILYPALKKFGIKTVGENGKDLPFRKLMNLMTEKANLPETSAELKQLAKETTSRLRYKNGAQILGYLYSGIVLGFGIPKLNIAITKYFEGKKAANQKVESADDKIKMATVAMMKPESKTFSAFGAYLD